MRTRRVFEIACNFFFVLRLFHSLIKICVKRSWLCKRDRLRPVDSWHAAQIQGWLQLNALCTLRVSQGLWCANMGGVDTWTAAVSGEN
jgi:hypothetical protein